MAILRELALDADGDLDISGGRLHILEGSAALAQRIATRLRTIKGEWIFDANVGTPWLQDILGTRARSRLGLIQQVIRKRIADTQGVARIAALKIELNAETRVLSVTGTVIAEGEAAVPINIGVSG